MSEEPLFAKHSTGETEGNFVKKYGEELGRTLYWAWHRQPKKGHILRREIDSLRARLLSLTEPTGEGEVDKALAEIERCADICESASPRHGEVLARYARKLQGDVAGLKADLNSERQISAEVVELTNENERLKGMVEKAVSVIKHMDCDCAGEGVPDLGGCYRCLALSLLSPSSSQTEEKREGA